MKRDMDLIFAIVREIESWDTAHPRELTLDGVDETKLSRHLDMMHKAGLLEAMAYHPISGDPLFKIRDLTWDGHEFAALAKNSTIWERIKDTLGEAQFQTVPLVFLRDLAMKATWAWACEKLGLPPN